jgi:hypothetical protein
MDINYFLKQSGKKVVFLIFIIPTIIQLILINIIQMIVDEMLYYLLFLFFGLLYLPYFYWLNITVNFLYSHSNKYVKLKIKNFKISLMINIIIIFNFVFFVAYLFSFVFNGGTPDMKIILYIVLIQFFGVASFAYNSYFVCKLISTIELNRKVGFSDIAGSFVTLLIPPLAVWIIHNKIKKMKFKDI